MPKAGSLKPRITQISLKINDVFRKIVERFI